jgi:hypothetical protein
MPTVPQELRVKIRAFVERPDNVDRMLVATRDGRPAAEDLSDGLRAEFGGVVEQGIVRRYIRNRVYFAMKSLGFRTAEHDVPIETPGSIFRAAHTYRAG